MNYEIANKIKETLKENTFYEEADKIDKLIRTGSTAGEITCLVGEYLNNLISSNTIIKALIKKYVSDFNMYAKSIGIY